MRQFTREALNNLLKEQTPPCVSIYLPTARAFPGADQNRIRFKNLIRKAEDELRRVFDRGEVHPIVGKLQKLLDDASAWQEQLDGLAVYCSMEHCEFVQLQRPPKEMVVVADTFHLKPLIRIQQTAGRYQVLCLTRLDVTLYEGNRDVLDEVELVHVPKRMYEAFGEQLHTPHMTGREGAGLREADKEPPATPAPGVMHVERFFRMIDQGIWEWHTRPSGLPLILCAVEENQELFRRLSNNNNLVPEGIPLDPHGIDHQRLQEEAWKVVEPYYHERTHRVVNAFEVAKARQASGEDLNQVAEAAAVGRVDTVLVDAGKQIGGRLEPSGKVVRGDINDPDMDDLLDDIAETVLKTGGVAMVVPPALMPTNTGVAAIYRW